MRRLSRLDRFGADNAPGYFGGMSFDPMKNSLMKFSIWLLSWKNPVIDNAKQEPYRVVSNEPKEYVLKSGDVVRGKEFTPVRWKPGCKIPISCCE